MTEKKMTRKEALELAIAIVDEGETARAQYSQEQQVEALKVLDKMLDSINKQAKRPRSKSSARLQNENSAKLLIEKLQEMSEPKPVNATWIAENIPYVLTSQRGYHVAKIAIEWGALEEVTIKKRTYYVLNENYSPEE